MAMPASTEGEAYDPFEAFDRAQGAGAVRDPYSAWAELRARAPVQEVSVSELFDLGDDVEIPDDVPPTYQVLSYEGVSQVLRDGETFSSQFYAATMGTVMGHSILEMDEPEHHHYRSLIQQAFTRKALERWETELVRPVVDSHIDDFAERGHADLVRELTFPFPVRVIAGMLGLPEDDLPQFHRWAVELISIGFDMERGMAASQSLRDYFAGILEQRRRDPAGDVISVLGQAELDGQRLTDEEIFAFLRLLLRHPPAHAAAHRLRPRAAHVPRHAPGPHGDDRRAQCALRPAAQLAPRPRGPRRAHHRPDLPRAALAARSVRVTLAGRVAQLLTAPPL